MPSETRLPLMKTIDDAVALCEQERDNFYLTAFVIQGWLGQLVVQAAVEYAEEKNAKDRVMQSGEAGRVFRELFGTFTDREFPHIYSSLLRFAAYQDEPLAHILVKANLPLSLEHDSGGDFAGPKTLHVARRPKEGVAMARRTVERWCDWIDAAVHFQTHEHWHLAPLRFDPDPDKRELSSLGGIQRHWAYQSEESKAWWQWHHSEAAERFKDSPKWPALGHAMASSVDRAWPYPQVDFLVISLWPLLKRHNWTYCDLMNVVRTVSALNRQSTPTAPSHVTSHVTMQRCNRPDRSPNVTMQPFNPCNAPSYPLQSEQEFATYCTYVLGLRKSGRGKTAKNGRPAGYEIALRLCAPRSGETPAAVACTCSRLVLRSIHRCVMG